MIPKASVRIEHANFDFAPFAEAIQERAEEIAEAVATEAKGNVTSKTGRLKRSIRVRQVDEAFVVQAAAPHAHLVEFGHVLVRPFRAKQGAGQQIGHVPPAPFLRPALDKVIMEEMNRAFMRGPEWRG